MSCRMYLLCAVACAVSCAAQVESIDPSESALAIWTEEHGAPTDECRELTYASTFKEMAPTDLAKVCNRPMHYAVACMYAFDFTNGASIALESSEQGRNARTHELLHALYQCHEYGLRAGTSLADNEHRDPVWRHVGGH